MMSSLETGQTTYRAKPLPQNGQDIRVFPGLCRGYCYDFFDKCRNLLWFLDPVLAKATVLDNRNSFCDKVSPKNVSMCYPDVTALPSDPDTGNSRCVCFEPTNQWLSMPVWAGHAGDGSGRLFVVEQRGRVRIYETTTKTWKSNLFLDMSRRLLISPERGDEKGLLTLAFHPDHVNNRRFFLFYAVTRDSSESLPEEYKSRPFTYSFKVRVSEMLVREDNRDVVDTSSEKILLEVLQPFQWHNGGALFFGSDSYLYVSFGDGGGGGDPFQGSQNNTFLHGTVIRIDVDSDPTRPYTIPGDNPFIGQDGVRPEIYSYGLRNPWRCAVDKGDNVTGVFALD
ncbi:HHIP 1-like protein [Elysia marginata]|uniref:HHIP 1-like protein n=1 Tax=Elysia marginata TaxID=1093978 RepID=A0AAV4F7I2_9GAST|nr:HHIP 1-like protein [Elysia marginata]